MLGPEVIKHELNLRTEQNRNNFILEYSSQATRRWHKRTDICLNSTNSIVGDAKLI